MSAEETKIKHSKRIHAKETAVKRQAKIAKAYGIQVKEPHVYAKHHVVEDNFERKVLNPRKKYGEETIQEKRAKQDKVELD